jgi:hypothetical protein
MIPLSKTNVANSPVPILASAYCLGVTKPAVFPTDDPLESRARHVLAAASNSAAPLVPANGIVPKHGGRLYKNNLCYVQLCRDTTFSP